MSIVTHRHRASAYPTPTENSAPGENSAELSRHIAGQAVFLDITQTFGTSFVPDLFIGMDARPAYFETAWEFFKSELGLDRMDRRTRHIVALAITTDETGTYCVAAYPRAFRLNALDEATCDKVLYTIRLFNTFEQFLSGVNPI